MKKKKKMINRNARYSSFIDAVDKMYTKTEMLGAEKFGVGEKFVDWLYENGFFTAPASTKYHGNYEGGLFDHSLAVTEQLVRFTDKLDLQWTRPESPFIVGMFHDLCKIDQHIKVVDEDGLVMMGTGDLKGQKYHYEPNDDCILNGHGDKSVMMLSQFTQLTEEEILCIRFHMGGYETNDWKQYDLAIREYQTVLWTHTADMFASKVKGV